jgi:hypothetical protein
MRLPLPGWGRGEIRVMGRNILSAGASTPCVLGALREHIKASDTLTTTTETRTGRRKYRGKSCYCMCVILRGARSRIAFYTSSLAANSK